MTGPSYGELLDDAARHVAAGAEQTLRRFDSARAARATLAGYDELLAALRAHVAFLLGPRLAGPPRDGDPDPRDAALLALHGALAGAGPGRARRLDRDSAAESRWATAAQVLRLAHDVLGTHLGPDRQHLTPDAPLLDEPQARWGAATRLAELALTTATAAQPLYLRAAEAGSGRRDLAARLDRSAAAHLGSAAGDLLDLAENTGDGWGALNELTPAMPPALRAGWPPPTADPMDTVLGHLDVLAQAAHDHGRGAPVGAATLRSYAALANTVCRTVAVLEAAAAEQLSTTGHVDDAAAAAALREALSEARRATHAWRAVYQAWQDLASPTPMSRGVRHRIEHSRQILNDLTRVNDTWRPASELVPDREAAARLLTGARRLLLPLAQLARNHGAVAAELRERQDLYLPRRQLPEIDDHYFRGAWRYAPAPPERSRQILTAYEPAGPATQAAIAALAATSGALGTQPRPELTRAYLGLNRRPVAQLRRRAEAQAADPAAGHDQRRDHRPHPRGAAPNGP
jgi:hypothetical protein